MTIRARIAAPALVIALAALVLAGCTTEAAKPGPTSVAAHETIPSCPSIAPKITPPNPASASRTLLDFVPDYAVVCRFSALPDAGKLVGSAVIRSRTKLATLARDINSFRPVPPGVGFACPAGFGSSYALYLGLGTRSIELTKDATGCGFLHAESGAYYNEKIGNLGAELAALTK